MKRGGKAPALFRQAFRPQVLALIAQERESMKGRPNAATERLRQYEAARDWLDGKTDWRMSAPDFKIEARQGEGRWRLVLLVGVCGYSAADPMLTAEEI